MACRFKTPLKKQTRSTKVYAEAATAIHTYPRAAAIHTYPRAAATIRIISERNLQHQQQQQQQPPPAAVIHTYPRAAATIRIISERNLQQQQQQPPPKETGYDYTPSPPPMKKSQTKRNTL